ncbi:uncharacterized protein [Aristolochia californica]|uniref:uncharacterized protein n=1 Tax=Aristolochia californica TaxID=171875 RepID=UPI0035E1E651
MIVLSWNVHGIGSLCHRASIRDLLASTKANVVVLQQTKVASLPLGYIRELWHLKEPGWASVDAVGSASGILLMWDTNTSEVLDRCSGSYSLGIKLRDKGSGNIWCLVGVYSPTRHQKRHLFWEDLSRTCQKWPIPLMLVGDFNVTRFCHEKSPLSRRITTSMRLFADFISSWDLDEIALSGKTFTWSNGRQPPVLSKLD